MAVYRDLSFSLAGHLALILALLAVSATRHPVRIAEVVRPVRLVTSLEPPRPAGSAPRPGRPAIQAPPAPAPAAPPAARAPRRAAEPEPPAPSRAAAPASPARTVAPIAIPRIAFPSSAPAPAPAESPRADRRTAPADAGLRERLARRLSAPADATRPAGPTAAPRLASLPRADEADPSPPAATAAPGATAPAGAGSAAVALAPAGSVQPVGFFPHAWYLAVLKERIFARWAPPSEFFGAGAVAALVSFRIDRAGRISGVAVKESSGHARFDRSALAAIQGLGQVPPLPEQYAEETLDVVIRFQNQ